MVASTIQRDLVVPPEPATQRAPSRLRHFRYPKQMRAYLLTALVVIATTATAQQQLWSMRHGNPNNQTGFGDVGLGLSLRHDSLLVGRSFNNVPALDLLGTDGALLWSFAQADTVLFDGGSCFLGDGALLAYRCVMNNGQGLRVIGFDLDGPVLDWSHDFHGFEVDHLSGPAQGTQDHMAWLVAAGERNDSTLLHVMACDRSAGVIDPTELMVPHPIMDLRTTFIPGRGLLVDAMLQHPNAFTAVPWEAMIDTSDLSMVWSTYLTDTTGFLVNAPAITMPWGTDTLLTAITTWSGQLRLSYRSALNGGSLLSEVDTLGITPTLGDLLVTDGAIHVATTNRFVMRYDAALNAQWIDTTFINAYYPGMHLLVAPGGIVLVNGREDGGTIGQDIEVSRFDGTDGTLTIHYLFNDAITNTHDILHASVMAGDTLFILTAATFDTLNILNERTEVSVTAFLADGITLVGALPTGTTPVRGVTLTEQLPAGFLHTDRPLVLIDAHGRVITRGDARAVDAVYRNVPAGPYFLHVLDRPDRPVPLIHP